MGICQLRNIDGTEVENLEIMEIKDLIFDNLNLDDKECMFVSYIYGYRKRDLELTRASP